ncbi:acetyltransferase (GNAT) family protein [Stackebrandtia endophytica]|uniref:Acetyltransferase (GNAT) family protein n=2 Tax=Stackebrandtia endophytica TaxID=1496996 RepID=A0A543B1G9_9ACTN|nr:acetyltransferase (GNAT) family protein [Stackebrandtia endophytica]
MTNMEIRPTTLEDLERLDFSYQHQYPDGWRPNGSSFVAVVAERIVGIVHSCPNRTHPTRDLLFGYVVPEHRRRGIASALVAEVRTRATTPLSVKAYPGTGDHRFAKALGATAYQVCPPATIDTSRADVIDWARRHRGEVTRGTEFTVEELTEFLLTEYEFTHQAWSPAAPRDVLIKHLVPELMDDLDVGRSYFVTDDAGLVAGSTVYGEPPIDVYGAGRGGTVEMLAQAPFPDRPGVRTGLAACIAEALLEADGAVVTFDGHVSDLHFYPLLSTIPGVTGKTLELLEIPYRG